MRSLIGFLLAGALSAQAPAPGRPADPYTGGDPALMERVGYVSFGPFHWADRHDTDELERTVDEPVLFVETAHFKIGSALGAFTPGKDRDQREKLRVELAELREKLPSVPKSPRTLDPWLRLHLTAQRVEALYADLERRLGFTAGAAGEGDTLELGPYLGSPQKYTILLTMRASTLGRYSNAYAGSIWRIPRRHNFGWGDSILFGMAGEFDGGRLHDDTHAHCMLAYNVAFNLLDGAWTYCQRIPAWWGYGIAVGYARRIDPRYPVFDRPPDDRDPDARLDVVWEPKVRRLVESGAVTPAARMMTWFDFDPYRYQDYLAAWSRVEFLCARDPGAVAEFHRALKSQVFDENGRRARTEQEVLTVQASALREAWGLDVAELDDAWQRWVVANYPRARRQR